MHPDKTTAKNAGKNSLIKILHVFLVALSLLSGTVKAIGVRTEFMKITHAGFADWKITAFGAVQITVALLLAFKRTFVVGAVAYCLVYAFAAWHYFANALDPVIAPVLLAIFPIVLLVLRKSQENGNPSKA